MSRYSGPVVDAHHHFWEPRLGHQPWLRPGAAIPFRYGDYAAIKRDFMPSDLRRLAAGSGIDLVGSVSMETEWVEDDPIGEMDYTAAIAARDGLPNAAVAHATLEREDVDETLAALADRPIVRAVRQKPGDTLLADPRWRRGFARLATHGLHFELQAPWSAFDVARTLFAAHPDIPVVINHAGLPADRAADAMAGWRSALAGMAELPHVSVKISGIGLPGVPWTAAENAPVVDGVVDAFGTGRVMFASNFPVDSLAGSYAEIYGGFVELTAGWSDGERRAAFAGNAVRVYRLDPGLLEGTA